MADDSDDFFTISTYIKYATIPSALILTLLCMLQKRQTPGRCGDRPGIVVLMRFLDGYQDRWAYALCFGAITSILLSVFTQTVITSDTGEVLVCGSSNSTSSACNEVWVKSLLIQAQTVVASLVCAPHFACITTPYKLVGAVLGFAYSVYWIVFYIVAFVQSEKYNDKTMGTLLILKDLPIVLCCIGLLGRSIWTCYRCYRTRSVVIQHVDSLVEEHQVQHVKTLFRIQTEPDKESPAQSTEIDIEPWKARVKSKIKTTVQSKIFPFFKLPTRVICIACVQVIIIYYFGISLSALGVLLHGELQTLLQSLSERNWTDTSESEVVLGIYDGVYVVAEAMGILSSLIYVALFVINYRNYMIRIYKGYKLDVMHNAGSPQELVVRSLRLPGYQLAYIVWGLLVMFLAVFFIAAMIAYLIYGLDRLGLLSSALQSLAQTLSVPATTVVVFYLQVLLVKMFLMQPKINKTDRAPPLNIDNRRVYEVVSYFLVFNNLVVGLASALLRTLKSFVLGVIFLGRLDRCLLMRGFETFDPGYMAYVGTLLVDNAHNNPTMRTFCAVLLRLTCKATDKEGLGIGCLTEPSRTGTNSRASRRWHLAYTLLHNPDLLPRRKLALLLTRGLEDGGDDSCNHANVGKSSSRKHRASWMELQHGSSCNPGFRWSMSDPGSFGDRSIAQTGYPGKGATVQSLPEVKFRIAGKTNKRDGNGGDGGVGGGGGEQAGRYGGVRSLENPAYFETEREADLV